MGRLTKRKVGPQLLLIGVVLLLAALLLYPIALTVRGGLARDPTTGQGFTFEHLALVFKNPALVEGLLNAFKIAVATTTLSIAIALPLAILGASYQFPFKKTLTSLILVPMILPPFVGAIGVRAILGREGALNALLGTEFDLLGNARFWGVVIVLALHLYPIIYLNAAASLANLDPARDEAAENLGASWLRRFFKITLPLIRPGLFAGATIVFIWSFTELGTPLMFDYSRVTSVQIFEGLAQVESSAEPYALTIILLLVAVISYTLGRAVFGRRGHAMYSKASTAAGDRTLSPIAGAIASGAFWLVTILAITPHIGVVLTSLAPSGDWYATVLPQSLTFDNFRLALASDDAFSAIRNSIVLSVGAVLLNIVLGILIAYLIVRTRVRGRGLLDALVMLPLAVPGLVLAFGYVAMTLRSPFPEIRDWLVGNGMGELAELFGVVGTVSTADPSLAPNPFALLIIAYAVRRLPYIVRSTVSGLEQTSGELEEAAVNLGASKALAIRKVVLPLILANLIAGSLLVFSFSMLEVSDSLILAQQTRHYPLTKAILAFMGRLGDGPAIASAMGVWGMALLAVTLVGASALLGKKLGAIFRI